MFHRESCKPIYLGVKVKGQGHESQKNNSSIGKHFNILHDTIQLQSTN